jgi:Na+/H+ antiporter NhaC
MGLRKLTTIFLIVFFNYCSYAQVDSLFQDKQIPSIDIQLSEIELLSEANNHYFKSGVLTGSTKVMINDEPQVLNFVNGKAAFNPDIDFKGKLFFIKIQEKSRGKLYHVSTSKNGTTRVRHIPLWLSILPPLIAIGLALIFKEVIVSLFIGIWAGVFIAGGLRFGSLYYFFDSLFAVVYKYIIGALSDSSHMSIIIFSLLIGGMVAIISKNGGMAGVVLALSKYAKSKRSAQFITWLLGVSIFFDDYANTLIVGNTMRSVTDKFKISREKLAYIVDSTAAPVASIAFITTWIGAELSYIAGATADLPNFSTDLTPYSIFISSLKYSFYPILTLIFILLVIYMKRDYGPMYKAEKRANDTGQVSPAASKSEDEPNMEDLSPVKDVTPHWSNAVFPVLAVILLTIFGLLDTGLSSIYDELVDLGSRPATPRWSDIWPMIDQLTSNDNPTIFYKMGKIIGASDSYVALLWASFAGLALAIILTISKRIMTLFDTMHWMTTGFKTMLPALIILTLAWSLAIITSDELHTADYMTSILEGNVSPYLMPLITFIMAAFIAFSTGSSWSTMAILYPIVIPTTWAMCQAQGLDSDVAYELIFNVISIVLGASVVGDHCSPISDTTILSSLASDCNHIDHVRTQLPYALTVGIVSLLIGTLSTFLGGGWFICTILLLISVAILYLILRFFGKSIVSD